MPQRMRRSLPGVWLAGIALTLLLPAAASAEVARPAAPSGMRVVAATASSFTVAVRPTAHAHAYRLYASTVRSDLYARNISRAVASKVSTAPRMTVSGLTDRSGPYFYRVVALHRHRLHYSETIGEVGLRPDPPTALTVSAQSSHPFLTWAGGRATGYTVEQATNPTMSADRTTYRIDGATRTFTPYGLTKGRAYYFRVRALNQDTPSAYTSPVIMRAQSSSQPLKVMTYNILEKDFDGRQEGGEAVAPWAERKVGVAGFISNAAPDVVAIQEGAAWVNQVKGPRQVDSLKAALGGSYALARTEVPPTEHYYHRTGDYILYRKDGYAAVGAGDHWSLGYNHWAAYQLLRNRTSGAKVLFVSAHLIVPRGHANDLIRQHQTDLLVSHAEAYSRAHGNAPIVYAGDYNSDQFNHAPDGPTVAMRAAGVPDAFNVAQHRSNARFNTSNQYQRRAPHYAAHMDAVFVSPGVAVRSWSQLLHVSGGRFVGVIPSDHNPVVVTLDYPY